MAQFTVHRNKNLRTAALYPYLIDIQNDLLDDLRTRVVVPVGKAADFGKSPLKRLMPVIVIAGEHYVLMTPLMAGIAQAELGDVIADVGEYRSEIVGAVDFLVSGV